ncbi:MAG: MFS transporter [Deltaproteobacteria bacterium]|nr:MFS transporter [Deltaproteobacteria bacterium]
MRSERSIVFLVGAVQFVNILDFMMVMPLGPDFARALGLPVDKIGVVGGAYTLSAAIAGIALSPVLDRFDRRHALAVCMAGLGLGTMLGGAATDMATLVAARVVAGAFGGPATSLALSIVADVIPTERRGRAMGAVMGAFSVASVLGVPAGLEAARLLDWRAPFFAVGGVGLLITGLVYVALPSLTAHIGSTRRDSVADLRALLADSASWTGIATTTLLTFSGFAVIPNLSAFIQFNLQWPRDQLGWLYMAGGTLSFVALRVLGPLIDRLGVLALSVGSTLGFVVLGGAWFVRSPPPAPVWVLFPLMMIVMSARNVAHQTQLSRVPPPASRAAFQSLNSAVKHLASAAAAMTAAAMLNSLPDGRLVGMSTVATMAIAVAVMAPVLVARTERVMRARG